MEKTNKTSIDLFLSDASNYLLLHESSSTNPNTEHYFISVTARDIKDNIVKAFIEDYQKKYPLIDLSEKSHRYIKNQEGRYYFLFLDSLDKKDRFFSQKEEFIKKNKDNILSLRMLGKAINLETYIDTQAEKYLSQFLGLSSSVAQVIKKEMKSGITNGLKVLNDNAPAIKSKLATIRNKIMK